MITFTLFGGLRKAYPKLVPVITLDEAEVIDELHGGNVKIVETAAEVPVLEPFDVFEKVDDEFAIWQLCTNNAGGDIYFIPLELLTNAQIQTLQHFQTEALRASDSAS